MHEKQASTAATVYDERALLSRFNNQRRYNVLSSFISDSLALSVAYFIDFLCDFIDFLKGAPYECLDFLKDVIEFL